MVNVAGSIYTLITVFAQDKTVYLLICDVCWSSLWYGGTVLTVTLQIQLLLQEDALVQSEVKVVGITPALK